MTPLQAYLLGVATVLLPSAALLAWLAWRAPELDE